MTPLEESVKGKLYYKTENGEYEQLNSFSKISEGFTLVAEGISESAEQMVETLANTVKELSFSFKLKHISRKRFKKLLMGYGWQRNEAEVIADIIFERNKCYTLFDLVFYQNKLIAKEKKIYGTI